MLKFSVVLSFAACVVASQAQVIASVDFEGQATMNTSQGRVTACGIRFLGHHDYKQDAKGARATVVDGSLSIMFGGAAVKGGQYRAATDGAGRYSSSPILSQLQWLRAGDGKPLDRSDGISVTADEPGFSMFTADMRGGADAAIAILAGSTFRVAFKGEEERTAIYSGEIRLKSEDADQFLACLQTLAQDAKETSR